MTTTAQTWTEETVEAAGARLQIVRGGTGEPLLVLHDEMGHGGWLRAHEALAQNNTLTIPSHPGFGASERLDWIMTVRDLAVWYLQALDDLKLGPVPVLGFSMGGWLAAEMAAMCPHRFSKLVLVAPPGIKPPEGEIYDMFLVTAQTFIEQGFHNKDQLAEYQELYGGEVSPEERERRESAREQSCRLTWRPYMHDLALPYLLRGVKVPTLLVWGREDAVVPLSAGEAYQQAIPGARLTVLDDCGHRPEIEQQEQFTRLVREFLAG
jgi:pimeloyl-ACP methyl ester carboxylesterase